MCLALLNAFRHLRWAAESSIWNSFMQDDLGGGFSSHPHCLFILGILFQVVITVILWIAPVCPGCFAILWFAACAINNLLRSPFARLDSWNSCKALGMIKSHTGQQVMWWEWECFVDFVSLLGVRRKDQTWFVKVAVWASDFFFFFDPKSTH